MRHTFSESETIPFDSAPGVSYTSLGSSTAAKTPQGKYSRAQNQFGDHFPLSRQTA